MGALERAKLAVEKHYAVVGVLEDMNTTLTVLENYIPRFFRGATDVYHGKPNLRFERRDGVTTHERITLRVKHVINKNNTTVRTRSCQRSVADDDRRFLGRNNFFFAPRPYRAARLIFLLLFPQTR